MGVMKIVSRRTVAEDPEIPTRPGWEGMHLWWLIGRASVGSEVGVVCSTDFPPDKAHALHLHPNADEIFIVIKGGGSHLTADGPVPMEEGDIVFVPRGEPHGFHNDRAETCSAIAFYGGIGEYEEAGYVEA
jgi:mannose-6-phosphate isomerase-like protein (cupin superfamily)